jgi:hypothetical protein
VCDAIKSKESLVDSLCLTAGYAPFGTREETAEGLEIAQSLEYYLRMLFILHLLPLLEKAEAPKVVSVLAGGMESATVDVDESTAQPHDLYGVPPYTALANFLNVSRAYDV